MALSLPVFFSSLTETINVSFIISGGGKRKKNTPKFKDVQRTIYVLNCVADIKGDI